MKTNDAHHGKYRCALLFLAIFVAWQPRADSAIRHGEFVETFDGDLPVTAHRSARVQYDFQLAEEKFFIHIPPNYSGKEAFGLIVYTHAGDEIEALPQGWGPVLKEKNLLFIAAQKSGNQHDVRRRLGLAVIGALEMTKRYRVDPKRVYAAGLSGGARMAGQLGFVQPDVFHGTIQSCGADFYEPVSKVLAQPRPGEAADAYGLFKADADEVAAAKQDVRFVFITGSQDFRNGYIRDIYAGGYVKAGFQAKLIDVLGMQHQDCAAKELASAVDFIEKRNPGKPSETPLVAKPAWIGKDPAQWPQILLANAAHFKNDTQLNGASGFLMKLPNGAVVAATATHILGDDTDPTNLDALVSSWTMSPRTMPQKRVTLKKIAMAADQAKPLDCLLMTVVSANPWPVEVLVARETPVEVGEAVYLIAVPYEEKSPQNIYKGKVTRRIDETHEFAYEFEGTVQTRGFSGAPVIDENGQVVGIHHGKFDEQPGGGKILASANAITFALKVVNVPAPAVEITKKPETIAPASAGDGSKPAAVAADDSAEKAAKDLGMAKNYVTLQRYDAARLKLQKIIDTYPKAPAAKDARKLLQEIDGK